MTVMFLLGTAFLAVACFVALPQWTTILFIVLSAYCVGAPLALLFDGSGKTFTRSSGHLPYAKNNLLSASGAKGPSDEYDQSWQDGPLSSSYPSRTGDLPPEDLAANSGGSLSMQN